MCRTLPSIIKQESCLLTPGPRVWLEHRAEPTEEAYLCVIGGGEEPEEEGACPISLLSVVGVRDSCDLKHQA